MKYGGCFLPASILLVCSSFAGSVWGGDFFTPTLFDLRQGSVLVDGCLDCERPFVKVPMTGTFTLEEIPTLDPSFERRFWITEFHLQDLRGAHTIRGSGTYLCCGIGEVPEDMSLDLEVNGEDGIKLEGRILEEASSFPVIDITVSEDGSRDPNHVYSIRIIAVPRVEMVHYELREGSSFLHACLVCGGLQIPIPVSGTLLLGEISEAFEPVQTYRVDAIDFSTATDPQASVTGSGIYRHWEDDEGGFQQEMRLTIQVEEESGIELESEAVPEGASLPDISIFLWQTNSPEPFFRYELNIVASPLEIPAINYHRGDSNSDGERNVGDAVFSLRHIFGGGRAPSCLDAADTDDSGVLNVTDAIYLLSYLFLGGPPPQSPFPECGLDPTGDALTCASFPPCE